MRRAPKQIWADKGWIREPGKKAEEVTKYVAFLTLSSEQHILHENPERTREQGQRGWFKNSGSYLPESWKAWMWLSPRLASPKTKARARMHSNQEISQKEEEWVWKAAWEMRFVINGIPCLNNLQISYQKPQNQKAGNLRIQSTEKIGGRCWLMQVLCEFHIIIYAVAGKVAQQLTALAAFAEGQSSIPSTYVGNLTTSCNPSSGNLTPSSGLHKWHSHRHT